MGRHGWKAPVTALLVTMVLALAGCGGGAPQGLGGGPGGGGQHRSQSTAPATTSGKASGAGSTTSSASTTSTPTTSPRGRARTMHFRLADASSGPVVTSVPPRPLAATPSSVPGVVLQLYVAQRVGTRAVLLVFALDVHGSEAHDSFGVFTYAMGLSVNSGSVGESCGSCAVSAVSLLDPVGLKEYQPFMSNPANDQTCLCSAIGPAHLKSGELYFAALVAAPPSSVHSVTFLTKMGSIGNVHLGG